MYVAVGDVVRVPKFPVWHYGVITRADHWAIEVTHASPRIGYAATTSWVDFAEGQSAEVVVRPSDPWSVVERARSWVGEPYRLFTSNCEHLVNYALDGRPRSGQVAVGVFALLAVAMGGAWASARA